MTRRDGVAGIVLAAGRSERMGGDVPKQLLPFGGIPMVARVVGAATASHLDRVVVVTGHDAENVVAAIPPGRWEQAHNPGFAAGNLTSLRTGLDRVVPCAAIVLLLGDMPGVDAAVIDAMIDVFEERSPWAAVAVYADGVPNHPFLLSHDAIDAVAGLDGRKPLWSLLVEAPPHPVATVEFDRLAPVDVDTPADYTAARRRLRG